jgi:hypothetical protein
MVYALQQVCWYQLLTSSMQALLVNNGTASTSEMLSATLHANTGALLIGEHTFGKGRTQRILNMKDGSTLLVSTSLVTTPAFETIDKVGCSSPSAWQSIEFPLASATGIQQHEACGLLWRALACQRVT